MAVRNFWIEAHIDGRATTLEGGPRSKDGGMSVVVYIRDEGGIAQAMRIYAQPHSDGTLELSAYPSTSMAGKVANVDGSRRSTAPGFTITTKR